MENFYEMMKIIKPFVKSSKISFGEKAGRYYSTNTKIIGLAPQKEGI